MSKLRLLSLLAVLFPAWTGIAHGEDSVPTPKPKPPFIGPLPDNTIVTVNVTNGASAIKAPAGIKTVTQLISIKSGPARELISEWNDGSQSKVWFTSGYRLDQPPGNGAIMVTPLNKYTDPQSGDFFDLRWLKLSNYVGIEDQKGQSCFHFKTQVDLKREHLIVDYSAFINVKTSQPVAWDVGPDHFEVVSIAPRNSSDPLVLPDTLANYLKAYRLASSVANSYKKP